MTLRRQSYLVEAAPKKATKSTVANLRKNDRLLVYHGTYNKEFEQMAHGVDALKVRSRSFNQGKHSGLFVAPDMVTAARFGRIVLELSLPVRGMHAPLSWSGDIDTKKDNDVWKKRYPRSFRPSLSASLGGTGEPQALYKGFIRPKDILGVYVMDSSNRPGPRMSLKDARQRFKIEELGVDLSNPRFSIADYVKMLKYPEDKIKSAIVRYKPKSADDVYDLLAGGGFGQHPFGVKALRNLSNQMYRKWIMEGRTLRRRGYLVEASYERDSARRRTATVFYDKLARVLKDADKNLENGIIRPYRDGFQINAGDFWRNPRASKLVVMLTPKKGALGGGLGKAGSFDVLIFPILLAPGSLKHAGTRLVKDYVVHEMIHYLDPGQGKGGGTKTYRVKGGQEGDVDPSKYFNDPGEWNAFWQEGAAMYERMLRGYGLDGERRMNNPKFVKVFVGNGSLRQARERVHLFWDKSFLKYMNKRTERKFDKRFAELWRQLKKEGVMK